VLAIAFCADQDVSGTGFALKASGEIHHVAYGGVVLVVFGA